MQARTLQIASVYNVMDKPHVANILHSLYAIQILPSMKHAPL